MPSPARESAAPRRRIVATVETGDPSPARHGRTAFRRNFRGPWPRGERTFDTKQLEVYAVETDGGWLAITVVVRYF